MKLEWHVLKLNCLTGFNNTTKKILHNTNIFSCLVIYIRECGEMRRVKSVLGSRKGGIDEVNKLWSKGEMKCGRSLFCLLLHTILCQLPRRHGFWKFGCFGLRGSACLLSSGQSQSPKLFFLRFDKVNYTHQEPTSIVFNWRLIILQIPMDILVEKVPVRAYTLKRTTVWSFRFMHRLLLVETSSSCSSDP